MRPDEFYLLDIYIMYMHTVCSIHVYANQLTLICTFTYNYRFIKLSVFPHIILCLRKKTVDLAYMELFRRSDV